MEISLLDPNLKYLRGHRLDLDLRIAKTLKNFGHDVRIYANSQIEHTCMSRFGDVGIAAQGVFRTAPYEKPQSQVETPDTAYEAARMMADDLTNIPETDLWFWPTFAPIEFLACTYALPAAKIVGGVWFEPSVNFRLGPFGDYCWARAAKMATRLSKGLFIGAYDDTVLRAYRSMSGSLDLVRFPVPHDGAPSGRSRSRLKRIGLLGYQRSSRGMALIAPIVQALLERGFEVTLQDSGGTLKVKTAHPRLRCLGYVDDFAAELEACDMVIWPSQAASYKTQVSGVVCESIGSGVPIILPSNCAPAAVVVETGSGVFFHHFSCMAVLEALDEAVEAYPVLVRAAERAAEWWREREGTARLARLITTS